MEKLIIEILKIAAANPHGFTVEIPSLNRVTQGWSIGYLETQSSFGVEGLRKVILHAQDHNQLVGGWEEKGQFYFDSVKIIHDEEEAFEFGRANKQIAIYEIHTNRQEYL